MQSIKNHTMHVPSVMDPQNIGSFIEWRAHHLIAGSRDPAGDIFFTRLILLRCQPEQRSYRLRLRDPARIVHRRLEGNCHQRTNARHCHQPSADRVFTNNREHSLVQFLVLRLQSCARRKHRLSNALQHGMACHQFPNPRFKRFARHLSDLQAEAAQDSPNAQFHVQQPSQKLLARNQQRPDLPRSNRFGVYRPEPSIRISCASPRASLRSVFTVIADNAAFTCRVSSRTASNPARISPACSHCDNGPASSPISFTGEPSPLKKETRASGSLATFTSITILTRASTIQSLDNPKDTSIPA